MERLPGTPDERRELHQPADPADLRRHPPRDAACARVRGMVRDYADGDLEDALRQAVDVHVHGCRDCGLALARAEHEVLRLRRAAGRPPVAPLSFGQRTVQRLLVELSGARTAVSGSVSAAERPGIRRRWLAGSLLLAAAVLIAAVVLFSAYSEIEKRSGAMVATARGVSWESAGGSGLLASGQQVPEGCTLVVEDAGNAELKWRLQAGNRQPSATMHLAGGSKLEVQGDEPRLLSGTAELDVQRPFALQVGDATRIKLAPGHYHVDAEEFRSFDDLLDGRGGSLRVRIETLQGAGASIVRGGQAPVAVAAGKVAVWQGWTAIVVDAAPDAVAVVTGIGGGLRTPARRIEQPALQGSVVEAPSGRPVAGAFVVLQCGRGGIAASFPGQTDETGTFQLPPENAVDTNFVVAQLIPPNGRPDLGIGAPTIVPVVRNAQGAHLPELVIDPSPLIQGTVRDPEQRALVGTRVVPCLIDELFGAMLPWVEGSVVTDARGWFSLRALPSRLSPYSRLGLLLLHPEVASCCVPIPLPGSLAAQECQLQFPFALELLTPVSVQRLPPGLPFEILEELPGAPAGSAVRVHQVTSDNHGTVGILRVGSGTLWLRTSQAGHAWLRRLVPADPSPGSTMGRYLVPDEPVEAVSVLRHLSLVPGTSFQVARSYRGDRFATSTRVEPGSVGPVIGAFSELTTRPQARAQLFAVAPRSDRSRGAARLLGVEDGSGTMALVLLANEQLLVAMADEPGNTSIGLVELDQGRTRVLMAPPGSVLLGEAARPRPDAPRQIVPLRFTPRSGLWQRAGSEFVRLVCTSEGWVANSIPAGEYDVTMLVPGGRTWPNVNVSAGQTIPLR